MCVCVRARARVCIYIYMYMYIYTYTYTYIYYLIYLSIYLSTRIYALNASVCNGRIYLSISFSLYLSNLSMYLSVYLSSLSIYPSIYTRICIERECVQWQGNLVCTETGRKFPIAAGIPNMLLNQDEI